MKDAIVKVVAGLLEVPGEVTKFTVEIEGEGSFRLTVFSGETWTACRVPAHEFKRCLVSFVEPVLHTLRTAG